MNRYANSLIARGYSREYAENAAADRADRAREDAIDRELEERARLRDAAPALLEALQQIAVLAEYGTTGPGKCKSDALTAEQATSLRLAISDISRAAIAKATR